MLKMSTVHAPTDSLKLFFFFFLLMNSSSSSLMSYCTLAIEFLELKYYTNYLFYQLFLSPSDFSFVLSFSPLLLLFFSPHSLILSIAIVSFFLINQMKLEKIKEKKMKKKWKKRKERDLFMSKRTNPNTKHKPQNKIQFLK